MIHKNYINGQFVDTPNCSIDDLLPSYNPCNDEIIGHFPFSTKEEVGNAITAARKAFSSWRKISRLKRGDYFDILCQLLKSRKDYIAKTISLETGKSLNESNAEVVEALHMCQLCFGKSKESVGQVFASELEERDCYVIKKPKGVVAVITPWNFPFALNFWCAAPSILEGNTVVFKPSELTPLVGQVITELYHEAGFPPGVFNTTHGDAITGQEIVNGDVNHICFTGSVQAGREIRKACSESLDKTCSCEMGSKSAVMVFDDADLDLAVQACLNSAFKLSGQRCVSASRLFIQEGILYNFKNKFIEEVKKIKVVDPFESHEGFTYGPLISDAQAKNVLRYNEMVRQDTKNADAQILVDYEAKGSFVTPFVYQTRWLDKKYLKREIFGPHVAIIPFKTLDDVINYYNDTDYGLALGCITNNYKIMREVRDNCDAGMIYMNLGSIGAESHLSFQGVKASCYGGGSAAGTFEQVVNKVSITVNHGNLTFPQGLK